MPSILDHLSLNVRNLDASVVFYERALAPLGVRRMMRSASGVGFGREMPNLWLRQGVGTYQSAADLEPITPVHLCFSARTRAEVDAFHAAAVAAGGRDFGAPGMRPQYHPAYYGAFVLDLDGHNLEAAIHTQE